MGPDEVRKQMEALWKLTFHDSDEYINLVFNNYFDPRLAAWHEEDGKVVAALLGVPYAFSCLGRSLPSIYLCGLATEPLFRCRGIMDSLLREISMKAREAGYSIAFLIPADEGLVGYYIHRGFSKAIFRVENRFVANHDFQREYINFLRPSVSTTGRLKFRYFRSLESYILNTCKINSDGQLELIISQLEKLSSDDDNNSIFLNEKNDNFVASETLIPDSENATYSTDKKAEYIEDKTTLDFDSFYNLIHRLETENNYPVMTHSRKDLAAVIEENQLSGGEKYVCGVPDEKADSGLRLTAVAFVNFNGSRQMTVPYIGSSDRCSMFRLLDSIKRNHPEMSMKVESFPQQDHDISVWRRVYGASDPENPTVPAFGEAMTVYDPSAAASLYGMAKIINVENTLKFLAEISSDCNFSILVEGEKKPFYANCERAKSEYLTNIDSDTDSVSPTSQTPDAPVSVTTMTLSQLQSILFRRSDADPLVMEAFGIPRLPLDMALLLD